MEPETPTAHPLFLIPALPSTKMFIYFCISAFVSYHSTKAAPILIDTPQDLASQSQLERTLFSVVWNCVSTIIICAWTSVHPNVPPLNRWKARWNRLRLMFWMIVAPELVLAWAVRQFFAAREIRDTYNERHPGWCGTSLARS